MLKIIKKILFAWLFIAISFSSFAENKTIVFAAASMTNVLEKIANQYQQANPDKKIILSFASSSILARQISEGAPADLFISADQNWMDFLADKALITPNSRHVLVGNNLVLIAPKNSHIKPLDIAHINWQTALKDSYLAVGDPDHVPAGIYAKAALTSLKKWAEVENKLARAKDVRAALVLVERNESPLGIVYETDAKASAKVKIIATFPQGTHPAIEYPVAILKDRDNQNSRNFLKYLQSDQAKQLFNEFGFATQ